MKPTSPCLNCEDRSKYCHVSCVKYSKYKENLDIFNTDVRKIKQQEYDATHINSYKRRSKKKWQK